jgi:HEAT repeat protein
MRSMLAACFAFALVALPLESADAAPLAQHYDNGGHGGGQKPVKRDGYAGPGDSVPPSAGGAKGPGDTAPKAPGLGDKPAVNGRPAMTPSPPNAPQGPTSPFLPAVQAAEASNDANWWMWWEFNKTEFLRPNRLQLKLGLTTGLETPAEREALIQTKLDLLRSGLRDGFQDELSADDAIERAEAVGAFGRMAGPTAVDALLRALEDPSLIVRQRAILALGAVANEPAFAALQRIAETGRAKDGGGDISGNAQPLAVAALAIGRRVGLDDRADRLVERVTRNRSAGLGDRIAVSAMIYQSVAPCAVLEKLAFELASDEKLSMPVRCRALEAVARVGTDEAFALVEKALTGPALELRRSAAISLALTRHARASAVGKAALEHENEPVTRGFIALSLGRLADPTAIATLIERVAGDSVDRPWTALGLGLAVRQTGDAAALAALRKAAINERNSDARPACWVALGLARDESSLPLLEAEISSTSDPIRTHYVATAYALIGTQAARDVLAARIAVEKKPMARVSLAFALGVLGRASDAAPIVEAASTLREPQLQALSAVSLGYLGALESVGPLTARLGAKSASTASRAGACAALGILLARYEPLVLAKASHSSNYTIYEAWMDELVQTTL